jgi:hypothetical protein
MRATLSVAAIRTINERGATADGQGGMMGDKEFAEQMLHRRRGRVVMVAGLYARLG